MKVFVIGDKSVVLGFRLVGIEGKAVSDKSGALDALRNALSAKNVGIILMADDFSSQIQDELDAIRSKSTAPIIIEIPTRLKAVSEPSSAQKLMRKIMKIRV